ncbi:phage holin family protein [Actinopolymorpha pittospori]|uniref:Membrane protein YqjE n=1 Tax=Actinopolymorpha pittospori TaxID=648752 RepID=A0A927MMY5_9ACTN|nr:phage holin family protein [Actinopolymorpha pittospori]MBE1603489.1 putative membrane protein YqjE [Actinopolymorpha pittospori]
MTTDQLRRIERRAAEDSASTGQLLARISGDASRLLRQEAELARIEIRDEAAKAGKAAGMFGGAGVAAHMVLLFGSLAAVFALAHVLDPAWAALVVTGIWLLVSLTLYASGRVRLRRVPSKPERTVETLKEDAEWLRHPSRIS